MRTTKVQNMINSKGNVVKNQFNIIAPEGSYFQSYTTTIAFIENGGQVYLDSESWDYSATTGKYRNIFLGEGIAETRKKIKSEEYILTDLNK